MSNNLKKSESRITIIDSIRGFSFIPMFIFHLYSTYDLVNSFKTSSTSKPFISFLGLIRNVFILLAGISLGLSSHYKKGIAQVQNNSNKDSIIKINKEIDYLEK